MMNVVQSPAAGVSALVNPKDPFKVTQVTHYQVPVTDKITDLATLTFDQQREVLTVLNEIYAVIEASDRPAAGYVVEFDIRAKGKRPINIILQAFGEREVGSKMEMPMADKVTGPENCAFCKNQEVMPGYEGATTKGALVMRSLEGNPLTRSVVHYGHFFDMPIDAQTDALTTAVKVVETAAKDISRYRVLTNIGTHGSQTFPHVHFHVYKGLAKTKGDS